MILTWMLVLISLATLLANVFWTTKMTLAAKLIVYRLSKTNIPNALARFVEVPHWNLSER